jgi:predicted 3-demethylubiquinone-9 3-methyltransferase (glyoxalase superfamily)
MASMNKISPCLWFDTQAEEAAEFYVSIFQDSGIDTISRFGKEGFEIHGRPAGSVMTVAFRLAGQEFTALNGGPQFKFNEAISLQVFCETQDEVDHFWSKLSEGGEEGPCGWLKDRFGLSWQVVPSVLTKMICDPDPAKTERVTKTYLQMKKFDIAALQRAYDGT